MSTSRHRYGVLVSVLSMIACVVLLAVFAKTEFSKGKASRAKIRDRVSALEARYEGQVMEASK